MEKRIKVIDIIRVLVPTITGLVLSVTYSHILDAIFYVALIFVLETLLRKKLATMPIILSLLLTLGYISLISYYIALRSDIKILRTVSQCMSIFIGLFVLIRTFIQKTRTFNKG